MKTMLILIFAAVAWRSIAGETDVCIYGATPAGIVAAGAAKQEGMSVVLIEPSRWVGARELLSR